jgi:hypothetical protein
MSLEQITRNAENQVAASLKSKVERFMSSKKKDRRVELAAEIGQLCNDLQVIVSHQPNFSVYKREAIAPLPAKLRGLSAEVFGRELTPAELAERNKRVKEDLAEDKEKFQRSY